MKIRKRSKEKVFSESLEAHLIGVGSGNLEFFDDSIKFHIEKGRIRKRKELHREIPRTEIEAINHVGNELSISWNETNDIFVIESPELLETTLEKIAYATEYQRPSEDKKIVEQQINEVSMIISSTLEITDFLFDILRSLDGWVDWSRIENFLQKSIKKAQELSDKKMDCVELDFSKLETAIKAHQPQETSKETLQLLTTLYDYFIRKDAENRALGQLHPNFHDAKQTILAYYTLNDIILGSIIGDEEIKKEQEELLMTIENVALSTKIKININELKNLVTKLGDEKGKESVIKKSRRVFRQELKI
jgi:hypothetical protein